MANNVSEVLEKKKRFMDRTDHMVRKNGCEVYCSHMTPPANTGMFDLYSGKDGDDINDVLEINHQLLLMDGGEAGYTRCYSEPMINDMLSKNASSEEICKKVCESCTYRMFNKVRAEKKTG
jgi:hypothetical protein